MSLYDPVAAFTSGLSTSWHGAFLAYNEFRVRVVDSAGAGVSAATVKINSIGHTTDANGYTQWIRLPAGQYTVTISKSGCTTRSIIYTLDRRRDEIEVLLGASALAALGGLELSAKSALKKLLDDNALALVTGLSAQGSDWPIPQVTKEEITTPLGNSPYISINIPSWEISEYHSGQNQGATGESKYAAAWFDIELRTFWYGLAQSGEDELFEAMGADWDKFVSRIVSLLYRTKEFYDESGEHCFRLPLSTDSRLQRRISVQNANYTAAQSGAGRPVFASRITFTLLQCVIDLSVLE